MIDLFASQAHYLRHLLPVWRELARIGVAGHAWLATEPPDGLPGHTEGPRPETGTNLPVMIGGAHDLAATRGRPVVYVEHGAGQTYQGADFVGEPGGAGMDRVVLFVCPNERVADRWRARYPDTPAVAVGCPAMDRWHRVGNTGRRVARGFDDRPRVAITWHWDCRICPESGTAWAHHRHMLPGLARWASVAGVELVGHAHPRWGHRLDDDYQRAGIRLVRSIDEIYETADVLVADNTSVMYEFASLGRPVVALNAPWYRRDVEHGLRFWSHVPGVQVDDPADVHTWAGVALAGDAQGAGLRARAVDAAYAHVDGHATDRAVAAIVEATRCTPS